ncbi:unnamed protein product [Bemisia tabaci]|uniref:UBX domain-containing protein 1 n=1 Tax=Bemisia tabaci TaxID=7038 RepID=A0A9P0ALC2_BEMTA|nr:unnamed protein product [Bemisia tabaci]
MSGEVQMLIDMGFSKELAEKGLQNTTGGVEPALEWILAHQTEMTPSGSKAAETEAAPAPASESTSNGQSSENSSENAAADASAKSIKCDECGKLFRTQLEVEFHAGKSGHSAFSESTEEKKPLTEEEKQEQLRKVEELLKQKRAERAEQEKRDALERERIRIKSGKEMIAAKKKLEEDEIKKMAELRRREKEEERVARERVRKQIEADKLARKLKYSTPDSQNAAAVTSPPPAPAPVSSAPAVKKDYTETKIQIRLTNGQALTQTFSCKEQLSAVRLYVELHRTDGQGPFSLMTNFPKKKFTDEDYQKPLEVLGLVPSAVVIVTKAV